MIWQQHSLNNRILLRLKAKNNFQGTQETLSGFSSSVIFSKASPRIMGSWEKNTGESNARSIHKLQWKVPSLTLGLLADVPWGKCGGDTCPGNGGTCRETTSVRLVFCESQSFACLKCSNFIWVVISLTIIAWLFLVATHQPTFSGHSSKTARFPHPLLGTWYRHINLTTATKKVTFLWHVEDDGTSIQTTNWSPKDPP